MRTELRAVAPALLAALVAGAATPAAACGFCIEDRVAAVYDQTLIESTLAQGRHVAFFALEGTVKADEATRRAIVTALESAGALPGTARVALENAACSVAYDPRRTSLAAFVKRANKPLAARGLALATLRMIDEGGILKEPQ